MGVMSIIPFVVDESLTVFISQLHQDPGSDSSKAHVSSPTSSLPFHSSSGTWAFSALSPRLGKNLYFSQKFTSSPLTKELSMLHRATVKESVSHDTSPHFFASLLPRVLFPPLSFILVNQCFSSTLSWWAVPRPSGD